MSDSGSALRSAEKSRISTCRFADRIAMAVVSTYRRLTGTTAETPMIPNVLAGFISYDNMTDEIEVLSLAVGTKYLSPEVVYDDINKRNELVHDCHAEVLARLALLRYIGDFGWNAGEEEDKTLHMYTSSAPCGNACIKRWVTSKKEKFDDEEKRWPSAERHEKVELHSFGEGQVEATFKAAQGDPKMAEYFPKGIVRASAIEDKRGRLLSCSDRIALWSLKGLAERETGRKPIFIESITVGRKFSRKCCERALCCRMEFKGGPTKVHHLSVMCSAVKFQEGGMDAEKGAVFSEEDCRWWRRVGEGKWETEIINSNTGKVKGSNEISKLAKCQMSEGNKESKRTRLEVDAIDRRQLLKGRYSPFKCLCNDDDYYLIVNG